MLGLENTKYEVKGTSKFKKQLKKVIINSEISTQLLVNIFTPNTPLHDGAVIIKENKVAAAACMLPLASDEELKKILIDYKESML